MTPFTRDDLRTLLDRQEVPCVSLYLPTHRTGRESHQGAIRFKNLLNNAEDQLRDYGLRRTEIQKLFSPARELLRDTIFWQHQSDGLVLFATPSFSQTYRLPLRFEELVFVGPRFHLTPLLPILQNDGRFYILAISQHGNKFYESTRHQTRRLELDEMPADIAEALRLQYEKSLNYHSYHPNPNKRLGSETAVFHGHSDVDLKEDILQYFHAVDRTLKKVLADERAPLVFAGVDYLFPVYREANSYRYLVDDFIPGSPKLLSADELHRSAWKIVEPIFQQKQRQAADLFYERTGRNEASNELGEILQAASCGRVDTLFVAGGRHVWGRFDSAADEVTHNEQKLPGDEELLDLAAVLTLQHDGNVYVVEADQVPGGRELSAVFRYGSTAVSSPD